MRRAYFERREAVKGNQVESAYQGATYYCLGRIKPILTRIPQIRPQYGGFCAWVLHGILSKHGNMHAFAVYGQAFFTG
jgi:hypothetical protein